MPFSPKRTTKAAGAFGRFSTRGSARAASSISAEREIDVAVVAHLHGMPTRMSGVE